jgi:T-complex protein 1 subunit zeta
MSSLLQELSPNAEVVSKQQALRVNVSAAIGLQNVISTNLGPTGTLKLLVGGAGQLKLTKDGLTLLKEMQIQHPTAALIARTATAQDEITGDGTTSTVILTGEILKQAEKYVSEGMHPRILTDGLDVARDACLEFLKTFAIPKENAIQDRDLLLSTARTSLQTKLDESLVPKVRILKRIAYQTSHINSLFIYFVVAGHNRWPVPWWMRSKPYTKQVIRTVPWICIA